jgi:hypothetical protein
MNSTSCAFGLLKKARCRKFDPEACSRVEGAVLRNSAWRRREECKCPHSTVVTGESQACKAKAEKLDRYFDVHSDLGRKGTCKCSKPLDKVISEKGSAE